MLLAQLETSNGMLFSNARWIGSVLVNLTGHCEQGQAYDHGTRSVPAYLLSLYAPPYRCLYPLNSARRNFLLDGNIRRGGGFQDKGETNSNWYSCSERYYRGQMQILQRVES
jgi:hypothetical protein